MNIVIEKNVPIPTSPVSLKWDFLKRLEVGDSFVLPKDNRVALLAAQKRDAQSFKLKTRTIPETPHLVRVWRIA